MRSLLPWPLVLLIACDLQPPKREAPGTGTQPVTVAKIAADAAVAVAPPTPPRVVIDAAVAVPPPAVDDAGKPAAAEPSEECLKVSAHIADIVIASVKDAAQKAALEQDRTKLVRRAAEGCTRDKWPAAALKCFTEANDAPTIETCGKNLKAP